MWFYFVNGIALPNFRFNQRYKIYKLRDELRALYLKGDVNEEVMEITDHMISSSIRFLPSFTLLELSFIGRKIANDPQISKESEDKIEKIEKLNNKELDAILKANANIIFEVSIVNMLGWLPILLPFFLISIPFVLVLNLRKKITESVRKKSTSVSIIADKSWDSITYTSNFI